MPCCGTLLDGVHLLAYHHLVIANCDCAFETACRIAGMESCLNALLCLRQGSAARKIYRLLEIATKPF